MDGSFPEKEDEIAIDRNNSVLYLIVYVLLIVAFNYFYVAIQYNPVDIANQLRKNNGTIPGIRPGKPTSDFITKTLSKITLIGAIFLAIVAGFPIILAPRSIAEKVTSFIEVKCFSFEECISEKILTG